MILKFIYFLAFIVNNPFVLVEFPGENIETILLNDSKSNSIIKVDSNLFIIDNIRPKDSYSIVYSHKNIKFNFKFYDTFFYKKTDSFGKEQVKSVYDWRFLKKLNYIKMSVLKPECQCNGINYFYCFMPHITDCAFEYYSNKFDSQICSKINIVEPFGIKYEIYKKLPSKYQFLIEKSIKVFPLDTTKYIEYTDTMRNGSIPFFYNVPKDLIINK